MIPTPVKGIQPASRISIFTTNTHTYTYTYKHTYIHIHIHIHILLYCGDCAVGSRQRKSMNHNKERDMYISGEKEARNNKQ